MRNRGIEEDKRKRVTKNILRRRGRIQRYKLQAALIEHGLRVFQDRGVTVIRERNIDSFEETTSRVLSQLTNLIPSSVKSNNIIMEAET